MGSTMTGIFMRSSFQVFKAGNPIDGLSEMSAM